MKPLVPMDDYGMFVDCYDTARVDSLYVAMAFEKEHKNVLRDIARITEPKSGLSEEFTQLNFELSNYKDSTGRKLPRYLLTRDGFTMLTFGYTGRKAMEFKELYIRRFNEMETQIKALVNARQQFPKLTKMVKAIHDNPKPYHYSNECDLLNRIVLGMSAKQFREMHGIAKGESIRPYLTEAQIAALDYLQDVDVGLLVGVPDFNQRKMLLQWSLMNYKDDCAKLSSRNN